MIPPDERRGAREAALQAAEQCIAAGRLDEARAHIGDAARLGAGSRDVRPLLRAIDVQDTARRIRGRWSGPTAFWVAAGCYLVISFAGPRGWTLPVWAALAFGFTPLLAGWLAGRVAGAAFGPVRRFFVAMKAVGMAMFLYTGISLIVLRSRITGGAEPDVHRALQTFLAGLVVAAVYGIAAGLVAGAASAFLAGHGAARRRRARV